MPELIQTTASMGRSKFGKNKVPGSSQHPAGRSSAINSVRCIVRTRSAIAASIWKRQIWRKSSRQSQAARQWKKGCEGIRTPGLVSQNGRSTARASQREGHLEACDGHLHDWYSTSPVSLEKRCGLSHEGPCNLAKAPFARTCKSKKLVDNRRTAEC